MPPPNLINIFFRFHSDVLDQETTETLAAEVFDEEKDYYKLKEIPFYLPKMSVGDIVWAVYNQAESALTYRKTIQPSGNSTIHVIIADNNYNIDDAMGIFEETGCRVRKYNEKYFAINVLAAIDYSVVKSRLERLQQEKVIKYMESGLSAKHQL